ncbi:hypothetical protein P389DRAFT_8230 [Cystobasidium minutum MCA 4210]|uniref:uncharacterized protein n=1 Tax=Cystobasidium minutum MCA 4210 TaxID=1397322 RepID=UPI0034CD7BE8|eukprot:jgi/Rhomi1/8230/CE8229_1621
MRWLNKPLLRSVAVLSATLLSQTALVQASPIPQAQGEPTEGAQSIPVDEIPGNPSAAHPGAPTVVADRQDAQETSPTYNDGMYTPWTPPAETAVETEAPASISDDNSLYLQPTPTTEIVLGPTSIPVVSSETLESESSSTATLSSSTIPTTPPSTTSADTTSSSTPSSTPSTTLSSSSSVSSAVSSSASRTATLDAARQTATTEKSSNNTKIGVLLPVVLSLGALALLLLGIAFLVWRRRVAKRRGLAARRYDDAFVEKGEDYDDDDGFGKEVSANETGREDWQTFNRYSAGPYDGIESGMAGAGVRSLQTPQPEDNDPNAFRPRESRRPLPMTPQINVTEYGSMPNSDSTPQDLDAMMAQARTGYSPYANRPQRNKSIVSNVASSIYSTLSLRSKKSRTGAYSMSGDASGRWDEHGAWQQLSEDQSTLATGAPVYQPKHEQEYPAGSAQDRPLLSAVDETPRKKGYNTYSPPESPSRNTPSDRGNACAVNRVAPPTRGYSLSDNPVPSFNLYSPKRTRSSATARSEEVPDTPSIYSVTTCEPMSTASPQSSYPDTLQPGRSPALGRGGVTPPLPSQHLANRALYRQKSGTTYSLGGMAGVLYSDQQQELSSSQNSYTAIPPRKPRKQSVLAKYKPRTAGSPLSDKATAGETDAPNPHRAVSAVVRASRAKGSSVDSHYSSDTPPVPQWRESDRYKLGQSQASSDSIDDLLTNVLGPTRSPA